MLSTISRSSKVEFPAKVLPQPNDGSKKKRSEFIAHIMHVNEEASYIAFLARLNNETPSPAVRPAELVAKQ
ncbi:hypothetical protein TOC8171_40540 [Pseudomonas syringae]